LQKGAKVITGGKRVAQGGNFFEPTVLTDDDRHGHHQGGDLRPGRPLHRFKTDAEAIEMANAAEFGVAAYF
jgi:succinate-semialdehyde dehydrogenase/glutarate-semialdehyde dehydrogenase